MPSSPSRCCSSSLRRLGKGRRPPSSTAGSCRSCGWTRCPSSCSSSSSCRSGWGSAARACGRRACLCAEKNCARRSKRSIMRWRRAPWRGSDMLGIFGTSVLGSGRAASVGRTFFAHDPKTGARLEPPFYAAAPADVDDACRLAVAAFEGRAGSEPSARGSLLRAIAEGLEGHAPEILPRAEAETALPRARLESELVRTCRQLALFADVAIEGSWVDA